jgi:hypothetical protein
MLGEIFRNSKNVQMKHFFIALTIVVIPFFSIAQLDNTFTISEIGWSFTPPLNFTLLDSSTKNVKINEGLTIWKKDLLFKNFSDQHNTIACSIFKGTNETEWSKSRPSEIKGSHRALTTQYPNLSFDSSTTSLIIDGIEFQKFSMIGKENGLTKYNHIQLAKFYKGFKVIFVYMFEDPLIGAEIEKQLLMSKFSK